MCASSTRSAGITKPFDFDELLARLRALIRRGARAPLPERLRVGPLELNTRARSVVCDGTLLVLTTREYSLMEFLVRHAGEVVGRAEIAEHVWDESYDPVSNVIDVHGRCIARAAHAGVGRTYRRAGHAWRAVPIRGGLSRVADDYQAQMRRLTRIVNDMFMLALADIDARPLERRELYLDEVLHECVRAARVLARQREIDVVLESTRDLEIRGDEALLRHLVMNLLENAVRHAPPRGVVRVAPRVYATRVEIAIEDSGAGIPAADRERVFERFVRLGPAGSADGGGLGSPIARWIAEQHGGTLHWTLTARRAAGSSSHFRWMRLNGSRLPIPAWSARAFRML